MNRNHKVSQTHRRIIDQYPAQEHMILDAISTITNLIYPQISDNSCLWDFEGDFDAKALVKFQEFLGIKVQPGDKFGNIAKRLYDKNNEQ
jgi:hypothetical protein